MKYDESIKVYRDIKATLAYSQKEGYENGITKGRGEGRMEVARNMKSRGMPIELISDITHIPLDELEKL